jgi:hypothetical protein
MATPRGLFTPELLPEGWFDETLRPEGWFSQDFLEPVSAAGAYSLPVTSAAINLTGSTVSLRRAARLTVSSAALALASSAVGARVGRKVAVTSASVALSGSNVGLTYTPQGNAYSLAVTAGAVSLSGQAVGLKATRRLHVASASIVLAGSNVALIKIGSYRVSVNPGAILLGGGEVGLSAQTGGEGSAQSSRGDGIFRRFVDWGFEEEIERVVQTPPKKKQRKQVAAQIKTALAPLELKASSLKIDLSPLDAALSRYEQERLSHAVLVIEINAMIATVKEARKQRNRKIALAMLMAA